MSCSSGRCSSSSTAACPVMGVIDLLLQQNTRRRVACIISLGLGHEFCGLGLEQPGLGLRFCSCGISAPGKSLKVLDFWSNLQAVESSLKMTLVLESLEITSGSLGQYRYWKLSIKICLQCLCVFWTVWCYINAVLL